MFRAMSNPAENTKLERLLADHSEARRRLIRIRFATTDERAIAAAEAIVAEAATALAAYRGAADSASSDA